MAEYLLTIRLAIPARDDVSARIEARVKAELIGEALGLDAVEAKLQENRRGEPPRPVKM